jgi:hypothetical protein
MNESDIIEMLKLLKSAYNSQDWDEIAEAIDYMQEYLDDEDDEEY